MVPPEVLAHQRCGLLTIYDKLVVSTHLKNIGQNGNLPQLGVKITNV